MTSPHNFDDQHRDEPVVEFHNNSFSTNASGLRPSRLRLLLRDKSSLLIALASTSLVPTSVAVAVWAQGNRQFFCAGFATIFGVLALLVTVLLWLLVYVAVMANHLTISKGLLTPGILSPDGRLLYCLANLSQGDGPVYYGILAIDPEQNLPEQEVVCASTFREDDRCSDRWFKFSPVPLVFGCNDSAGIAACRRRIPAEYWNALRRITTQFDISLAPRMLLLDENFELLGEVSTASGDEKLELTAPKSAQAPATTTSKGCNLVFHGICALVLFGCSGLGGGVYSIVQYFGQEDAHKLANEFRNHPIVLRELGGIGVIEKQLFSSGKRQDVFQVRGPRATGKIVKKKFLGVETSVTLTTANGEWALDAAGE